MFTCVCIVITLCSTAFMIVYKTRLSIVCSLLRPSCAVAICAFALLGSVGSWALAVMTGNNSYKQLWDVTEEYVDGFMYHAICMHALCHCVCARTCAHDLYVRTLCVCARVHACYFVYVVCRCMPVCVTLRVCMHVCV